ncbi:MAG: tetraacyldisaccharide 4'-kinase [Casimicrobiaceae bacterium]|nr:tetraacyldisaccharide 4'-kinase [Casimicrobiaceae bacterium]MCX8099029.1 tetraacyldisaccharide 4'-kinase [Casimicrobiaceae bacterium]MDW8312907.1 tetraacyldisaccharide 4'-kinase [Burkholderiales bacterium]
MALGAYALARQWWRASPGWLIVLAPLAALYAGALALRRLAYRLGLMPVERAPVPVIAIGNCVVGGTGKTPVTLALARALSERGFRPGIITRGYPACPRSPRYVTSAATAAEVGDEALVHAAAGWPVVVGRDRLGAAALLCASHPEVNVLLADDALQHWRLARSVAIELVSASAGYGNGWLLPVGPLRERPGVCASGTLRAVLCDPEEAMPLAWSDRWRIERRLGRPRHLATGQRLDWPEFCGRCAGGTVAIVCGIAQPMTFVRGLARYGVHGKLYAFPDHHRFSRDDLARIDAGIVLVTSKDAVKLRGLADARVWEVPLDVLLPEAFVTKLIEQLRASA